MSYCRTASEAWYFIEQEIEEPTYDYDEEKLASVKKKICEQKEVILPKLEKIFAMY